MIKFVLKLFGAIMLTISLVLIIPFMLTYMYYLKVLKIDLRDELKKERK